MTDSERQFVLLIFRASGKYPSWDPEVSVQVGDYGRITRGQNGIFFWRRKGIFVKEGNIYENGMADKFKIGPPKVHERNATEGVMWITSENAQQIGASAKFGGSTPGLAECKIKANFRFSRGRGAVLAMDDDTITTIDPPGILRRLLGDKELKDSVLVSEVHSCSAYARVLTSDLSKELSVGLTANPPVLPTSPAASADVRWVYDETAGNFRSKVDQKGEKRFYPLFRLVSLKEGDVSTGLRGEADDWNGPPPLPNADPPWQAESSEEENKRDVRMTSRSHTIELMLGSMGLACITYLLLLWSNRNSFFVF